MDIGIEIARRDGAIVVAVTGEVDLLTAPKLAASLEEARGSGADLIVVDLSGVSFLDSSGLGALVTAHRDQTADGRGRLRLVRPRPSIDKVLTLTRLTEVIDTFDTLDAALA